MDAQSFMLCLQPDVLVSAASRFLSAEDAKMRIMRLCHRTICTGAVNPGGAGSEPHVGSISTGLYGPSMDVPTLPLTHRLPRLCEAESRKYGVTEGTQCCCLHMSLAIGCLPWELKRKRPSALVLLWHILVLQPNSELNMTHDWPCGIIWPPSPYPACCCTGQRG